MSQFGDFKAAQLQHFQEDDIAPILLRKEESLIGIAEWLISKTESPIEAMFARALIAHADYMFGMVGFKEIKWPLPWPLDLTIQPQYVIEELGYRVDFVALMNHPNGVQTRIVIECDGHDFHERTKEQAARDRSRDRDLALNGWKVLRFTGSEIHKDAELCVSDFYEQVQMDSMHDYQKGLYEREQNS